LGTALNDDDDDLDEDIPPARATSKRADSHNVQPKVESLEFLEDAAAQHIQASKQQNITYMNMDTFTEKAASNVNQPQQNTARKLILISLNQVTPWPMPIITTTFRIHSSKYQPTTTSCTDRIQIR